MSVLVVALTVGGACSAPRPSMPHDDGASQVAARTGGASPSEASGRESAGAVPGNAVSDGTWYEVQLVGDRNGNLTNTLLYGSLEGSFGGELQLGSQTPDERRDGIEPFAWTVPQAAGIFNGQALVWGRNESPTTLERVDLMTGSVELLLEAEATIHVATSDPSLTNVFLITVDEASNRPTGLWVSGGQESGARRLAYEFDQTPVSNLFGYRMATNEDGSVLAVQAGRDGDITLVDADSEASLEVDPGGPMVGFVEEYLLALGPLSEAGGMPLIAFDVRTGRGTVIADDVHGAQIPTMATRPLVAAMRVDPTEPRRFEILAIDLEATTSWIAHEQDPAVQGPPLAVVGQREMAAELPADWALLADSFVPYIEGMPAYPGPVERHPKAINLITGETASLGPFR